MPIPTEKELLEAVCHIGHRRDKWNPKMAKYLYGTRRNIHIFDLEQTKKKLEQVAKILKEMNNSGKTILFVSTKQQSIPLIEQVGKELNQPIVTKKWIPGLLTNWTTIKKRIKYYLDLQQSFQTGEVEKYTKKEQLSQRKKLAKLDAALSGVAHMTDIPQALFVIDAVRDHVAVLEAKKLGIPIYGICDSNADPDEFTEFIHANDDAVKSLNIILGTIVEELGGSLKPPAAAAKEEEPIAA